MHNDTMTPYELLFNFILRTKHEWALIAERNDMTLVQLHAIGLLMHGTVPMVRLSTLLSCDASYVTGIVDRLEEQGLVERQEDPGDRRVKLVALTKKGKVMRDKVQQSLTDLQARLFSCLDPEEQAEFGRLLAKIGSQPCEQIKNP